MSSLSEEQARETIVLGKSVFQFSEWNSSETRFVVAQSWAQFVRKFAICNARW